MPGSDIPVTSGQVCRRAPMRMSPTWGSVGCATETSMALHHRLSEPLPVGYGYRSLSVAVARARVLSRPWRLAYGPGGRHVFSEPSCRPRLARRRAWSWGALVVDLKTLFGRPGRSSGPKRLDRPPVGCRWWALHERARVSAYTGRHRDDLVAEGLTKCAMWQGRRVGRRPLVLCRRTSEISIKAGSTQGIWDFRKPYGAEGPPASRRSGRRYAPSPLSAASACHGPTPGQGDAKHLG